MPRDSKTLGAYFTPEAVAAALVQWAVRDPADLLLDPSSGDGRFVALHSNSVGVERDPASVAAASRRAPHATIVEADFFTWAADDCRRFHCAAGNPPFIRYQRFNGATRRAALDYCRRLGVTFSGLSSSWAPFIVAAASKLRPGGRIAFVVPAEIGHAPYAVPLLDYLVANFGSVHVVAIKEKVFPRLSEDCWLLFADNAGCRTDRIRLSRVRAVRVPVRCRRRCRSGFPSMSGALGGAAGCGRSCCRNGFATPMSAWRPIPPGFDWDRSPRWGIGYVSGGQRLLSFAPVRSGALPDP